jgi:hypothetical protein
VWRHGTAFPAGRNQRSDGAAEDGQPIVGAFVHPHYRAHAMRPQRARRDLQGCALAIDGVVIADPALPLEAQDIAAAQDIGGGAPARSGTKAAPVSTGSAANAALLPAG